MPIRLFLLVLIVAACDTPSPHFRGIEATRITVDGSVFDIRIRDDLAEAIRVNSQYAPRLGPIQGRAAFGMARVSGCKVDKVSGDQALLIGQLDCGSGGGARPVPVLAPSYSCVDVTQWANEGTGLSYTEFECDPIAG